MGGGKETNDMGKALAGHHLAAAFLDEIAAKRD